MKGIYFLLAFIALSLQQCSNKSKSQKSTPDEPTDSVPACVRKIIDEAKKDTLRTSPIQIDQFTYNGKDVYLFTADCCDQYNTAYDQDCNPICSPSGGITGKGDMKCPDFSSTAKFVKLIWKKP